MMARELARKAIKSNPEGHNQYTQGGGGGVHLDKVVNADNPHEIAYSRHLSQHLHAVTNNDIEGMREAEKHATRSGSKLPLERHRTIENAHNAVVAEATGGHISSRIDTGAKERAWSEKS
jgi:hypothetical protein